jgi:hypothetical protein
MRKEPFILQNEPDTTATVSNGWLTRVEHSVARDMLISKTGVYYIRHHVLQNIVIHKYMSNSVDVEGVRSVIIDYFTAMGLDKPRAALELSYQFKEAGRKVARPSPPPCLTPSTA